MTRTPSPRFGIAEWFGNDITAMTADGRRHFGRIAAAQDQSGDISNAPLCPFLSTLIPGAQCNKASGVCSIRSFSGGVRGSGIPVLEKEIVTVCPSRFLQPLTNGKTLFSWISWKMLGVNNPTIVKETPFLLTIPDKDGKYLGDKEVKKAGRIDWIIVNPYSMDAAELEWCAVETQALYFSGNKMRPEFDAYAKAPSPVLFPLGKRRPDYRSSGPKRLAPQLDVKVPVLRAWGKKVAVVIDRFFYDNMNDLGDAYPRAKTESAKRDNAEVVWFVVDYDSHLNMMPGDVIYASLGNSRQALNATEPLSKSDFTHDLKRVINDLSRSNKVFKASE